MTEKKKSQRTVFFVAGGVAVVMICVLGLILKVLLSEDSGRRKRQIQQVTLMTPPPPPKVKEKEPEPEIEKKEEVIEQEMEEPEPNPVEDQVSDEPPPGDDLALDADGGDGSDSFGLKAKKGGRSIIGGGYSNLELLKKYAWYTRIVQEELRKKVNKYMEENGGLPDDNLDAVVQITLDGDGNILTFKITDSSGDATMDEAVAASLNLSRISEPPPQEMPKTLKLKISAKG
jgi:outer membrane biosynthesis protein TonB